MISVGNMGVVRIHTYPKNNMVDHYLWSDVFDHELNLILKASSKTGILPKQDAVVTCLRLFKDKNESIGAICGKRVPNISEIESGQLIFAEIKVNVKM